MILSGRERERERERDRKRERKRVRKKRERERKKKERIFNRRTLHVQGIFRRSLNPAIHSIISIVVPTYDPTRELD